MMIEHAHKAGADTGVGMRRTGLGAVELDKELADAVTVCHLNLVVGHHAVTYFEQRKMRGEEHRRRKE